MNKIFSGLSSIAHFAHLCQNCRQQVNSKFLLTFYTCYAHTIQIQNISFKVHNYILRVSGKTISLHHFHFNKIYANTKVVQKCQCHPSCIYENVPDHTHYIRAKHAKSTFYCRQSQSLLICISLFI